MNRQVFDENFLMAVATIGAIALGDYQEGTAVMLFYQIGELFQSYAVGKSRRNISELMDIRPDYANIEQDGKLEKVDPDEVEVGTIIVVQPGEKIPIDGTIEDGNSTLNTSALTGESLPRDAKVGDEVISGCINMTGVLKIRTTKEFGESTVSKILDLVENSSSKKSRSHLYNTIGFIGIFETMKKFGYTKLDELGDTYYTDKASAFGKKIFETMRNTADSFIKEYHCNYQINTEQIPGESDAAKLMKKDKFFYPNAKVYDLPLYGNQFIPLGIKTTGQERVRIASEFDGYCSGGSILHYNIDAPFDSFDKAWKMVNYIADQGVTYFAFNTKIQTCKNNHAFYGTKCPICGNPVDTEFTRIVGFYTPVKTYSKERKAEFAMREWGDINAEAEVI